MDRKKSTLIPFSHNIWNIDSLFTPGISFVHTIICLDKNDYEFMLNILEISIFI